MEECATASQLLSTNWDLCVICQEKTEETLQCPANSKRSDIGAGYKTLSRNLQQFSSLGYIKTLVSRLDEGNGIEQTFIDQKASWHKSCYSQYNSTKLKRAEKRKSQEENNDTSHCKFTRLNASISDQTDICFICKKLSNHSLHKVLTFRLDARVSECAAVLNDENLLATLSKGDLIAQDALYHRDCLTNLYRKAASASKTNDQQSECELSRRLEGIALAELVTYIEESHSNKGEIKTFKLEDLAIKYKNCLQQLGQGVPERINTSRLKERLLIQLPDLNAFNKGRDCYLAFSDNVGEALYKAQMENSDDEAIYLAKAAAVIRQDMLKSKYTFSGSFEPNCQENAVAASLLSFASMVLYGPNIEAQTQRPAQDQAVLSISQLVQYNSLVRRRNKDVKHNRRVKSRETPLPIYIGMATHAKTRCRELVETLHTLGISISYDRVLAISTDLGNEACNRYHDESAVCPLDLLLDLFTVAAVDNIDHNPSSTTSQGSFHGTGISLFQHSSEEMPGRTRKPLDISSVTAATTTKSVKELPDDYTNVLPVLDQEIGTPAVPNSTTPITCDDTLFSSSYNEEKSWLIHTSSVIRQENLVDDQLVSWGAFHSALTTPKTSTHAISSLLPLLPYEAKSTAMIKHSMDVIKSSIGHLNPGQVPVIAYDQPLFAVAKQIQWRWSEDYGEKKFVVMFGGLHIEMAFLKVLGNWLEGSGWTELITESNVASSGTAESFLKASNVVRTRRAHQVTACALFAMLEKAYDKYKDESESDVLCLEDWCIGLKAAIPQFQYWYTVLHLEILLLLFIKSLRTGNFDLYISMLHKMLPWFFATNHPNYARWLSVHLRDMCALEETVPEVAAAFKKGLFTVSKTRRSFSAIPVDQAHEQNNAVVKGEGGAVGLTEIPNALRRWMLSGPEVARLNNEFQYAMSAYSKIASSLPHHETEKGYQVSFFNDVKALESTLNEMGNPFLEDSQDLFVIDTKVVADKCTVEIMKKSESLGKEQFETFVKNRLVQRKVPLDEPIKRNKLDFFTPTTQKKLSRVSKRLSSVKKDSSLFSRLYIACQTRQGDLDEFFKYENQAFPPSLSDQGTLRLPTRKSELTESLEALTTSEMSMPKDVDVMVIDGAAAVHMIKPIVTHKTFSDYSHGCFIPYIEAQLAQVKRVDVVWDEYKDDSLKAMTRSKRGPGVRQKVEGKNKLPRNWKEFLRVNSNKQELFEYLATCLSKVLSCKQIITTYGEGIMSVHPCDKIDQLQPCTQEEADTRMLLHTYHAVQCGHKRILLRTVDTDVLVLLVASIPKLHEFDKSIEVWIGFGTGKHHRYIPAHGIANSLAPQVALALPAFHAFTGCDTVSMFFGKGKKTALNTWNAFTDVTDAFTELSSHKPVIDGKLMASLERFVVLLYDRSSTNATVDTARKHMFVHKGRQFDNIPPTRAALDQHVLRTAYQAGCVWGQSLVPAPSLPSPQDWGWSLENDQWVPLWTTLPDVVHSCQELISCSCVKGCRGRCSCAKNDLRCSNLCRCSEQCNNR